ncbi:DNA polymerase III subunit delta [Mannheimia granulomatis]|uniref:DNA polymerase III subunit delta n=1 Tax=Mannheimia granulomatis TaxID=85402 RepID=UPI00047D9BD7|nr:DNA polymerase III subunit delta [Mannheimia granulomatis]QLB19134.1 DNA polymerase III subunit delta [Mannheimia granulomatis]
MQKIFPETIQFTLEKGLQPFYLLTGSDLLLVNESKDLIVHAARAQGFDEKQEVSINNETNWETLFESAQSIGLFFTRQIIVFNFPESPTSTQFKQLAEFCALSHSDLILIIHLPKFSKTMEKQAWFSQIEPQLIQINCQTPEIGKLPQWLSNRSKAMNLSLENEANQLLCYSYEGNLLALKQALQLLQLRFPDGKISLNRAQEIVEHSAQFTPFQWIDALFEGKIGRAQRILQHLQNEDVQAVVLLRIVQKELMILLEITRSPTPISSSNQPLFSGNLRQEFDRLKIWQNRRPFYTQVVQRLSYKKLYALIQQLAELERKVKQEFSDEIWQELARFSANFA